MSPDPKGLVLSPSYSTHLQCVVYTNLYLFTMNNTSATKVNNLLCVYFYNNLHLPGYIKLFPAGIGAAPLNFYQGNYLSYLPCVCLVLRVVSII